MKRFFVKQKLGADIILTGPEFNHLGNVMRAKTGDKVVLVCGDAFDYGYVVGDITRDNAQLTFVSKTKNKQNPTAKFIVFAGLIKFDNLSLTVEKLNELGVSEFVPFTSGHSNIAPTSVNREKLQTIAEQSCKQCGRSIPMIVNQVMDFDEMLEELSSFDKVFYADRGEKSVKISQMKVSPSDYVALVIGPEGGLSLEENLAILEKAQAVTLGKRTLRSETAAIAASAVILGGLGEL